MSLADALNPHVPENAPLDEVYLSYDAEQPASIDQDEEMDDLFDEDAVVDQAERYSISPSVPYHGIFIDNGGQADAISDAEQRHREAMEYAEEDDEPDQDNDHALLERTEAAALLPNIPSPKSSDGQSWVIRIPNFVKVDSKPFHPDTYVGPDQEDEELAGAENSRESSMSIKLKVENTLRWRWVKDEDGNYQRQSNSRIIRWSDGSLSLLLGKELFDISQQLYISPANTRSATSGSQPSQSRVESSQHSQSSTTTNQGLTYLVAQHKRAEILQSEALITGYMQLRPTGMQSETHRMLVRAVGQKHNKVARLRMAPDPTQDPEKEKMELMKQTSRSKPKRQKIEDDGFGNSRAKRKSYSRKRSGDGVWSDDEEEAAYEMYGGESDEDQDLDGGPGRRTGRKGRARSGGDARKGSEYKTDDFVVSDSPSDGADSESGKRSKRKMVDRGQSDEDDLDKLDAKIEQQEEAERKRGKSGMEEDHPEPEEMDVESEEPDEDDEHQVRKAGGKRRRLAAGFDEDDE
ncbi:Leo1-domain-containing protein [Thelephora ganbajun]|uniref:Leo1-domain-containing protein n=1 Tax=Thelephora ganbajun TaxID=370292 RepID=A0ACB6ZIA6_THEGA|nr:Leo1-domain-containing protein [Thelephora ganbajun]